MMICILGTKTLNWENHNRKLTCCTGPGRERAETAPTFSILHTYDPRGVKSKGEPYIGLVRRLISNTVLVTAFFQFQNSELSQQYSLEMW